MAWRGAARPRARARVRRSRAWNVNGSSTRLFAFLVNAHAQCKWRRFLRRLGSGMHAILNVSIRNVCALRIWRGSGIELSRTPGGHGFSVNRILFSTGITCC